MPSAVPFTVNDIWVDLGVGPYLLPFYDVGVFCFLAFPGFMVQRYHDKVFLSMFRGAIASVYRDGWRSEEACFSCNVSPLGALQWDFVNVCYMCGLG